MEIKDEKKKSKIELRRTRDKGKVLGHLRKMPVVEVACQRAGIGRATYYRWLDEDKGFAKAAAEAIEDGEKMITGMSEAQLISLIKDKHFPAIMAWLKAHHPKYASRLEVVARTTVEEKLNPEQEALLRQALNFSFSKSGEAGKKRRMIRVIIPKHENQAS